MNNTVIPRVFAIFILIVLLSVTCLTSFPQVKASSFSNVQVNIQTASSLPDHFTVSAFNMTGYLVASTQTHYSAASFEVPDGQYIFAVTADVYGAQIYYSPTSVGAAAGAPSSTSTGSAGSATAIPTLPYYVTPVVEYGYTSPKVSGAATFTIQTQNVTTYPTNTITVKASYVNGTPAAGATVSASVIGSYYYWGYEPNVVTWATTQADGTATLITPLAPVQIDVWNWLPVNLPASQTTVQVTIGGELVNVTAYWQPTYVGLAGSTLIVPPQTSASVTLHMQQPNYWVTPYSTGTVAPSAIGAPTVSSGSGSVPAQVAQQQQGNPTLQNYQQSTQTTPSTPNPTIPEFPATSLIIIALTAASVAIIFLKKTTKHKRRS